MQKGHYRVFDMLMTILGGLALLFIVSPLLSLFFHTGRGGLFEAAADTEVQASVIRTLLISFSGTLIFAFLAVPLSYVLARKDFKGKRLVSGIIDLPIIIPHTAAGIALLGLISRDTYIGKVAEEVGLNFVGHPAGIALAMAFVSIPFLVNSARDGFANVPLRYEQAALNLGASPLRVFSTISVPLAWRNIMSGFVMMFGRGMSEFGAVVIIAYHPMITPVLIYQRFTEFGLDYARPVAVLFIFICLILFILLRSLASKKQ